MNLQEISSEKHSQLEATLHHPKNLVSYDGNYQILLEYAGEYRMGDTWHWGKIVNTNNNEIIWEYNSGYQIRSISTYPWSFDSKTCYFSLIEQGNQIVMVDIESKKLKRIFKCRSYEKRTNWILTVMHNVNGILFYSENFPNGYNGEKVFEFYFFTKELQEPILINTFIEDKIIGISESDKKDHLIVITHYHVIEFNMVERSSNCIHVFQNDMIKVQNILYTKYLPTSNQIIFKHLANGWNYYKIQL